jgi:GntR family transcriptional regulator
MVLPNENDLAREFALSPGTVRKALEWMEREQLIVRQQGRGTFIQDPASTDLASRYLCLRSPEGDVAIGEVTSSELSKGMANDDEVQRLAIAPGAGVYRIVQRRDYGQGAVCLERRIYPVDLFPNLEKKPSIVRNAGEFGYIHGVLFAHGEELVSIVQADADAAVAMGVPEGSPVLHLDRMLKTVDGQKGEWRVAWCALGKLVYEARI